MPHNSSFLPHQLPYEKERKDELDKSLAVVRLFYFVFCIVLLVAAQKYFSTSFWQIIFFTVAFLVYGLIRYFKPTGSLTGNISLAADLWDFLFAGVIIYLTGGLRSFMHVAHAIPICGSAIRFGVWGGITGFMLSLAVTVAMFIVGNIAVSLPLFFHIIAGIGTLAFATWLVVILAEKELQLHKKLYLSSITDSLTGLYNFAYLRERVMEAISRYHREGQRFTLVFLDLDNFKKVNDRHGHLAGDVVLKQVAELLIRNTRGQEILVRYGGDEFILFMPNTGKEEGEMVLERLKKLLYETRFSEEIGVSGGVAVFPEDGEDLDTLLAAADKRMYAAKLQKET